MSITIEDVHKIAALAKLKFSPSEEKRLIQELSQIVSYVEKLNALDTDEIEPTAHILELSNVLRDDQVEEWLTQDEALQNAPRENRGYFSVPKVLS